MVAAPDLGSGASRRGGSSPSMRTPEAEKSPVAKRNRAFHASGLRPIPYGMLPLPPAYHILPQSTANNIVPLPPAYRLLPLPPVNRLLPTTLILLHLLSYLCALKIKSDEVKSLLLFIIHHLSFIIFIMDITRVEIGTLNEELKISITPDDYQKQFETELKKVQKSISLPGFRPGHVPVGLVKKKYGKAILVDELNKIVSGSLENYITESKLDLLGSPIPQPSNDNINNFDDPGNFEFVFEIGLAPQFDLTLPPTKTFDYYEVDVDDAKVEAYTDDLRRKYGKFSNPETSDEHSIFYGDFAELDEEGKVKEGGLTNRSTFSVALVKDEEFKKQLIGLKKGDVFKINPAKAFNNNFEEIGHMLNKPAEEAGQITSDFNYTIDTINHIDKAEMDQTFFDKIFGEGSVTSVEDFIAKVRDQIKNYYTQDSDVKLKHDIEDHLLNELDLKLPDPFLQKWLQTEVEKPLSPEQVEKEYGTYSRSMKLRLIENKIFRDMNMQISQEEINEMARQYILHQFQGYSSGIDEQMMENLVKRYLEKRESVQRLIETLSERKVFNYLKSIVKTKPQTVKYEDFVKIVNDHHHH